MTALNLTNMDTVIKTLYKGQKVEDSTYQSRPLLGMLAKSTDFTGRSKPLPIQFGHPQGRSRSFASAQAQTTPAKFDAFELRRVKEYSVAVIDGETALATQGDSGAFVNAMTAQIDGAMETVSNGHETYLFRDGTGSIGTLSADSVVSAKTITLASAHDVTNFEVGMTLQASATASGSVRTGAEVVAGVDRGAGVLTATSAAWNAVITALAAGDHLFNGGDAANGGARGKISGLEAWIPETAPTSSDSFFGVNRSVDSRLMGHRHDGSSSSLEEALIDGQSVAAREGAAIDTILMNHVQVRTLKKELGSRIEYGKVAAKNAKGDHASISFRSLSLEGDTGPINIVSANKCPANVAWGLQLDTWKLECLGEPVRILQMDGLRIQRLANDDGYEVRVGFYGQLGCRAPGKNVRIKLSTPA